MLDPIVKLEPPSMEPGVKLEQVLDKPPDGGNPPRPNVNANSQELEGPTHGVPWGEYSIQFFLHDLRYFTTRLSTYRAC